MKKLILLCSIALLFSACSNQKVANKANFTKAIQAFLDKQDGVCINIPKTTMKIVGEEPKADVSYFADVDFSKENKSIQLAHNQIQALVKLGLLKQDKVKKDVLPAFSWGGNKDAVATDLLVYTVTKKGSKSLAIADNAFSGNQFGRFCTGKYEVDEIVNFTEPGDVMGMKVSRVKFKVKLTKLDDWIKDKKIQELYSLNLDKLSKQELTKELILTNEGWSSDKMGMF